MPQHPLARTIDHDVSLRARDAAGCHVTLRASFGYEPDDPYAVWVSFRDAVTEGSPVRWALSRDVLLAGLREPAGDGDVHVWPSVEEDGRGVVVLDLHSPGGHLVALVPTRELECFLARTVAVVPEGHEARHLDLDALVAGLLGRSEAE